MTPDFARLWDRTREAYLASHALFPVSQFTGRYCREWLGGGNVLEPMYPGLDLRTAPRRAAGRMAGQSPMILYVGRLSQGKRLDVLIQAFMRMRLPAELHIAGSGEERGTLEKLAGDRTDIRFHGFVDDDRMWSLYEACDVVAYPTAFEGFGMPPMHALYFRKPCVASDLPVLREVFGDCLEYVSLDDIDGFARTLERVLSDPDYRRRRGDEGHAYVVARFDWEKSARQMVAALEDSCRASSSVGRAVGLEKSDL
jgi:glycosyltransferase involved in cell wall biosynthesis